MVSTRSIIVFILTVLTSVLSIEAWLPPFFPGYPGFIPGFHPGFHPGFNPFIHGMPFLHGFHGAAPSYYGVTGEESQRPKHPQEFFTGKDDKGVVDHPSPNCMLHRQRLQDRTHGLQDRSHGLQDRYYGFQPLTTTTPPPTPFFGSGLGAFSPINWLIKKWPVNWTIPPATTHYYDLGNGNGWGKMKTWSWNF